MLSSTFLPSAHGPSLAPLTLTQPGPPASHPHAFAAFDFKNATLHSSSVTFTTFRVETRLSPYPPAPAPVPAPARNTDNTGKFRSRTSLHGTAAHPTLKAQHGCRATEYDTRSNTPSAPCSCPRQATPPLSSPASGSERSPPAPKAHPCRRSADWTGPRSL